MRVTKYGVRGVVGFAFLAMLSSMPQSVSGLAIENACERVEVIYARGSGEGRGANANIRFKTELERRIQSSDTRLHYYELGTDSYNGVNYPAVKIDDWVVAPGALVSAGQSFKYGDSVAKGKTEFKSYVEQRMKKCGDAVFVVGGYSQGAQVVREGIEQLTATQKDRIASLALFGDPKLFLPEGLGGTFAPQCYTNIFKSKWRRAVPNCRTNSGSLLPQIPYLSDSLKDKTGLWCNDNDFVCGSSRLIADYWGHYKYAEPGQAIDKAVKEAAEKVKTKLPPLQAQKIDTKFKQGDGIAGQDIAFIIDGHSSMTSRLPQIKDYIRKVAAAVKDKNGRVAISLFGANDPDRDENGDILPGQPPQFESRVDGIPFEASFDQMIQALDEVHTKAPDKGSPIEGMRVTLESLNWRQGAAKSLVLFTNQSNFKDPDYNGDTKALVLKRALEIDPVSIFPVVPQDAEGAYQVLADKSSGKLFVDSGEGEIKDEIINTVMNRPVVLFGNSEYAAPVGQEITFDVSQSYVLDSTITKYDWDFDGDLEFEETTTMPEVNHTYAANGDRIVQVRATAANGMISNGSVVAKVGPAPQAVLPRTPLNLKVAAVSDQATAATLSWLPADTLAAGWAISVNGVNVGIVTGDKTTIEVTDLQRVEDIVLGVAGIANDGSVGDSATVVLAKPVPTVPVQPCTTGTWLQNLICQSTLWYNMFIQQVTQWWFALPR